MHAAHAWNAANGFNFTAADITLESLLDRILPDRFYVAIAVTSGGIVGTIELKPDDEEGSAFWDLQPGGVEDSWGFHMLAVAPDSGLRGVGRQLVEFAQAETRRRGARRLTLDTPENHPWLPTYYAGLGFERIGYHQWPGKTYRSVLMGKPLGDDGSPAGKLG